MIIRSHKIGEDITATITITGDQRQFATISFTSNYGVIGDVITLSPEVQHMTNVELKRFFRKIKINNIRMRFPYQSGAGNIEIRCEYTNLNGANAIEFNGVIASWTLDEI